MTIGDKIKKIRTFRKMTQAELGAALGWGEKGANRLAQYETNYRVPKKELVTEMAKILDVNPWTLYDATTMDATEFMELLFWIDEFNPSAINLFQMETYPGEKCNSSEDTSVRYHDNDSWPAHPPVGLWINYGLVNDFMKEWVLRKEEMKSGEITRNEYFEWKINWPQTCDGCGKHEPKKTMEKQWKITTRTGIHRNHHFDTIQRLHPLLHPLKTGDVLSSSGHWIRLLLILWRIAEWSFLS